MNGSSVMFKAARSLADRLAGRIRHVIALRGGTGKKEQQAIAAELSTIRRDEERVLLATCKEREPFASELERYMGNYGNMVDRWYHRAHHHDLFGLTPEQFDAILSVPEPNPVPKPDRWTPR